MGTNHKSFESSSRLTVKGGSSKHTDLIVKTIIFGKATSLLNRSWNNLLRFEHDENINNKIFTTVVIAEDKTFPQCAINTENDTIESRRGWFKVVSFYQLQSTLPKDRPVS